MTDLTTASADDRSLRILSTGDLAGIDISWPMSSRPSRAPTAPCTPDSPTTPQTDGQARGRALGRLRDARPGRLPRRRRDQDLVQARPGQGPRRAALLHLLTVYDDVTGLPLAMMDCSRIGSLRTPRSPRCSPVSARRPARAAPWSSAPGRRAARAAVPAHHPAGPRPADAVRHPPRGHRRGARAGAVVLPRP